MSHNMTNHSKQRVNSVIVRPRFKTTIFFKFSYMMYTRHIPKQKPQKDQKSKNGNEYPNQSLFLVPFFNKRTRDPRTSDSFQGWVGEYAR